MSNQTLQVNAIQAWMEQIHKAIEAKNRDELNPIEQHIMHWICFNGFEDMHDLQIEELFNKYGFELPDEYVDEICSIHQHYSDIYINDPVYHGMKKYFRAEFFDAFEKIFEVLDYVIRFDVELRNVKGNSCYATMQFKLSDLRVGLHEVEDVDDWAELIRNETNFDVEIYQEHGIYPS